MAAMKGVSEVLVAVEVHGAAMINTHRVEGAVAGTVGSVAAGMRTGSGTMIGSRTVKKNGTSMRIGEEAAAAGTGEDGVEVEAGGRTTET